MPSPSPVSSNSGAYVRYFLPDDVISGNQYTFTVTPIDASGKRCESPASANVKGTELYLGYDANGGTGAVAASYGYNGTTTVKIAEASALMRAEYGFIGWNTKADGTETAYSVGASYTFGTSSQMLYAQWLHLSNVTVSITTPGYTGTTITQNGTAVSAITMDKEGTLNLSMPLPAGATDYHWYLGTTEEATTETWSLTPVASSPAITAGTYTVTGTALCGGVSYSSSLVVTVTNDYMVTMIPYGGTATYKQETWTYEASTTSSSFIHTLKRPFSMAKYEVSYELWSKVYLWAGQTSIYVWTGRDRWISRRKRCHDARNRDFLL